jgi:putative tributyrin esterase
MAFATINYHSLSLRKASSFNIVFPDDPHIARPWSVFYLLHGLSDDRTIWIRRTSIERYVEGLPLVVVMPDGGRGWYTNALEGLAYEDDLLKDVIGLVDRTFPVRPERAGRAIGGLSMGGYGAVKLGLKHPEMFASINSHSGAVGALRDLKLIKDLNPEFGRIFGKAPVGGVEDPAAIVERIDHGRVPALRLDCGTDDFLLEENRSFHRLLGGGESGTGLILEGGTEAD